jgi:hypothetical protein
MLLLFVVMSDQPLLTILVMGVEIMERGDSDIIDPFNKDLAERQAQASFNHMSDSEDKVLVNYVNAGEDDITTLSACLVTTSNHFSDDSVVQLNQDKLKNKTLIISDVTFVKNV